MSFSSILDSHSCLHERRSSSLDQLARLRDRFAREPEFADLLGTVFCAGSLARLEVGSKSDLDLFVTADLGAPVENRLYEYTLFAHLIRLNSDLGYPPFSNDGEFLKIYYLEELKNRTGSRRDDSENLFTVRMLLMLESRPLVHDAKYKEHLETIIDHYYRDEKGKRSFRPLFLLNDILRYWRTLCLNYEERRHDTNRPWRKKNINLKFSRMLTVFATVLPLVAEPVTSATQFIEYCTLSPLERLAKALDRIEDPQLLDQWPAILDVYEEFLSWKEDDDVEKYLEGGSQKAQVAANAENFSLFLYSALTSSRIPEEYRRYLVL